MTVQSHLTLYSQNACKQKQEAHRSHRSPEKQFQSINTNVQSYDYTKMLIKKVKRHYLLFEHQKRYISFLSINMGLICLIPFIQGCFVPSLIEIGSVVFDKIFKFPPSMYVPYFIIISLWKRVWPFIWINLNTLYLKNAVHKFGWYMYWSSGSGDLEEFQILSM